MPAVTSSPSCEVSHRGQGVYPAGQSNLYYVIAHCHSVSFAQTYVVLNSCQSFRSVLLWRRDRIMRYLAHAVLHHRETYRHRAVRESFGLDSAACWCGLLTLPASPAAHALATAATALQLVNGARRKRPERLTLHPEFSWEFVVRASDNTSTVDASIESIELRNLTHSPSHSRSPSHSTSASDPPSPALQSPSWPTPPPLAVHKQHNLQPPIPLNNLPPIPMPNPTPLPQTTPSA